MPAILLPCPRCGEAEASIALHLGSLDATNGDNFTCEHCSADFSIDDVRQLMARWAPVLAWVEIHPQTDQGA